MLQSITAERKARKAVFLMCWRSIRPQRAVTALRRPQTRRRKRQTSTNPTTATSLTIQTQWSANPRVFDDGCSERAKLVYVVTSDNTLYSFTP
jgi:hypothetical protein